MIMLLVRLFRHFRGRSAAGAIAVGAAGDAVASPGPAASVVVRSRSDGRPSPASHGLPALLVHQTRFDLRASFRNPRARFFTFAFPILLLVILVGVRRRCQGQALTLLRPWHPRGRDHHLRLRRPGGHGRDRA